MYLIDKLIQVKKKMLVKTNQSTGQVFELLGQPVDCYVDACQ